MESDQGGELGDIIRASSGCRGTTHQKSMEWQLPSEPLSVPASPTEDPSSGSFGDPFSNLCRDPLLQELPASTGALHNRDLVAAGLVKVVDATSSTNGGRKDHNVRGGDGDGSASSTLLAAQKVLGEEVARPCSIFSRFLQISPTANEASNTVARRNIGPPILVDHAGLQISSSSSSSSSQALGTKRRKNQAKKVVCIPAPTATGSRPGGEVVPSDLWAWRKYGQKPIKGSPYPRGYYRCSSSKGCSARKQVERSRADPNMLVITYTSEHNHPWPTQRNPLAGSTRPQPARRSSPSSEKPQAGGQEERQEWRLATTAGVTRVKEEGLETEKAGWGYCYPAIDREHLPGNACQQSYKPMLPESFHSNDFFSELGELEPDPMELVFSKGLLGEKGEEERDGAYKALDPFNVFDWVGNVSTEDDHCTKRGGL